MNSLIEFFNSTQVITALTIIAMALYYLAFERKPHKRQSRPGHAAHAGLWDILVKV